MRKIICIILILIICSFSVFSSVYAENNMTELQTKQEELQNQINTTNEELEDVQVEISANLEQKLKVLKTN